MAADPRAAIAAGTAVIGIGLYVVNADALAAAARSMTDLLATWIRVRAADTGAAVLARAAVIGISVEIGAGAITTGFVRRAGTIAGATMVLISVEVEALAVALFAAVFTSAFAAPAFRARTAIAIAIAIPADLLAVGLRL